MRKIAKQVLIAAALVAAVFTAAPAMARSSAMPTGGQTSQPIGHYEFCKRYGATCTPNRETGPVKMTRGLWNKLIEINSAVNKNIVARTDEEIFGTAEYWTYPTTQGDCEDFALLKQYMLERDGVPASAVLLTVLRQSNGDGHAVLTVRTDMGDFILDNLDDRVLAWTDTDYTFLKRQSAADAGKWTSINDDRNILVGSVR